MQKNLLEYLEHTARRLGDKIAFSDERETVTFWGLNQRSRAIGTALAQAVPGQTVRWRYWRTGAL